MEEKVWGQGRTRFGDGGRGRVEGQGRERFAGWGMGMEGTGLGMRMGDARSCR